MCLQIVENQEHLPAGILNQHFEEFDQLVGVEVLVNDHPVCLALIRHRGNHRQLLPGAAHR